MKIRRVSTLPALPARPADGHKGTFGRVLVVGGSAAMIGAPALAGTAALRMGAGLVQLAVPDGILAACLSITPELIGLAPGASLQEAAQSADSAVVGPGMGQSSEARARVIDLIRVDLPMVIDADALNILAALDGWPRDARAAAVLTPHPGEMKRLCRCDVPTDDAGRIELVMRLAQSIRQVVVLKGHRTVVADGRRVYVNRTGDSSLAKAGTGDVLSGMLGTLLAQKMDRFNAACAAVWLHGRSGELAGKLLGARSVLARDVMDALPKAIREFERK